MQFVPDHKFPLDVSAQSLWFVFHEEKLLTKLNDDNFGVPRLADLEKHDLSPIRKLYLGSLGGRQCFAGELSDSGIPDNGFALNAIRRFFGTLDETLIWTAGRANQLVHWNREHQFCGKCGVETENSRVERAKICPSCGLINYPRVSPAIIIAVVKNNQILLARNKRFKSKFFSVLAGFVEPGETLEECAQREIFEEVNLKVKNIRYFESLHDFLINKGLQWEEVSKSLAGLTFCMTGKGTYGRKELQMMIEKKGGTVRSMSKSVNYLVTADPNSQTGKAKKARGYNIPIISYEDLMEMLNG